MKKLSIILLLSVISLFTVSAESPLQKGGVQLNTGIGFSGWAITVYSGMDFGVPGAFTLGFAGSCRCYINGHLGLNQ
jgi:outer membrane immunogenic protein